MSQIGRIFIVVNLVLSAAFLGWAGALLSKSDEFKKKYDAEVVAHAVTKTDLGKSLETTRSERDETKQALATSRDERARFEGDADRLGKELATAKEENAQLRGSVQSIDGKLGDFQQNLTQANNRIAELDRERDKLREDREKAVEAQLAAENEKNNAVEENRRGKEQIGGLQTQVADLTKERDRAVFVRDQIVQATGISIDKFLAQPNIQGHVLKVLPEAGLVALNVGSDDGVQRGFTFGISRGGAFKGNVTVDSVEKKMCSARISLPVKNQTIEEGDRAGTRIP